MVCICRCFRARLFLEIFFPDHVVARFDSLSRRFDLFGVEHQRRPVADHLDHEPIRRLRERLRQLVQRANLLTVDFIDNLRRDMAPDKC